VSRTNVQLMQKFLYRRVFRTRPYQLLAQTALKWQRDQCLEMGASVAYYALFSLFPLVLIVMSVFGSLLGPTTQAFDEIMRFAQEAFPEEASKILENTLRQFNQDSSEVGWIGSILLLVAASGFFSALNRAFNRIWQVELPEAGTTTQMQMAFMFLRRKFLAFALVIGTTTLLLASQLSNLVIRAIFQAINEFSSYLQWIPLDRVALWQLLQVSATWVVLAIVVAILYKILPETHVHWRDVWLGSMLVSILFVVLQRWVSTSTIALGVRYQSYGAIGSVMVLMLWIYLSSQIFFIGGELSYIYAHIYGSRRSKYHQPFIWKTLPQSRTLTK
jgi:membrane protein